jgi:hypothetical protein
MAKGIPSKRRNKKNKKDKNADSKAGQLFLGRTDFTTGEFTGSFYPPEAIEDMQAYMMAHSLIPFDYEFGSPRSRAMVATAVEVLETPSASSREEILASLAILGHSPCPEAYVALSDYVDSDKPHAGVACFALDECLGMSEAMCA